MMNGTRHNRESINLKILRRFSEHVMTEIMLQFATPGTVYNITFSIIGCFMTFCLDLILLSPKE